jgi:Uncharacterized protein conserved in bacteria
MEQETKSEKRRIIALMSGIILLLLIILFSSIFYIRSSRPMAQAKQEAVEIAKQYASIEDVEHFYWFNREETYFTVLGKDDKQQEMIAIIPKSGSKITVLKQSDGLSEADAKEAIRVAHPEEAVKKATLGMFNKQPVWEVMTKGNQGNTYFLLDFKTGKEVKVISNI